MYNLLHDLFNKSFHNFDIGDGIQCRIDCPKCARLYNEYEFNNYKNFIQKENYLHKAFSAGPI